MDTHQNKAHWGTPSTALLSVYTRSGSGELIHWTDLLLLEKKKDTEDTERDKRDD